MAGVRGGVARGLTVAVGRAVRAVAAVGVQAHLLQQLGRDVAGVLALGVAAAPEEPPPAALAGDHRLAALVAVDVRREPRWLRRPAGPGGGGRRGPGRPR